MLVLVSLRDVTYMKIGNDSIMTDLCYCSSIITQSPRSASSGGKVRFGPPIDRARREKAVGMTSLEMVDDRSEPRWFEVTGDPVPSPSIDGGIVGGRTDLYDFIE